MPKLQKFGSRAAMLADSVAAGLATALAVESDGLSLACFILVSLWGLIGLHKNQFIV